MPTWLLIVILLIVIAIIIWILVSGNPDDVKKPVEAKSVEPAVEEPLAATISKQEVAEFSEDIVESVESDDLKKIEGIGPKISGVLGEKGILTFSQLAKKTQVELKTILVDAKIRIANPTTWPEQASLAADEKWEELEKLQDELKGGRRV